MLWTVVLICKNENATLPRLVKSLAQFQERGGKIIVVDTGSSDSTPEVARSLGCEVHCVGDRFVTTISEELAQKINERFGAAVVQPNEKLFDYSAARNYAASLSKTDWVWAIDADEVATKLDLDEIDKLCSDPNLSRLEYDFVFSHDQFGKPAVSFMHSKFYRKSKMKWVHPIHEVLQDI